MNDCEKLQKEQNLEDEKLENIKYKNNELSDKYLKVSKEIENFIKKLWLPLFLVWIANGTVLIAEFR